MEWNIKKADDEGARTFTKENMRGCIPKCPQQTNFSDCGVFVLQYVESFFKVIILWTEIQFVNIVLAAVISVLGAAVDVFLFYFVFPDTDQRLQCLTDGFEQLVF